MDAVSNCLRENARAIAEAAADQVDLDEFAEALEKVVLDLASKLKGAAPLDTAPLKGKGATGETLARLLRAMESQCVVVLRAHMDPLKARKAILALRERVRASAPKSPPRQEDVQFFHNILEGPSGWLDPAHERLTRFTQGLLSALRDMVYVHDVHGHILYVNRRGLAMTKYNREDLLEGITIYDLVAPEYVDVVKMRLEAPGAAPRSPYVIEVVAKDGERIPLEVYTRPMVEAEGITAIIGIGHEIKLERNLEERLQESYSYLSQLVTEAPIGIVLTGRRHEIQEINPAAVKFLGAPSADAVMGKCFLRFLDEPGGRLEAAFDSALHSQQKTRRRHLHKTPFGEVLNCDLIITPMRGGAHDELCLLTLMLDLSQQVALEETIYQRERLGVLGSLVGGVAHEINNPLTGILGYAQLLLSEQLPEGTKRRVDQIAQEASRCRTIIRNLLRFSHFEAPERREANINVILTEVIELREYQLRVDKIELVINLDPGIPSIVLDPHALQSVFLNIITNAQQAMSSLPPEAERRLEIATYIKNDTIHVSFTDTGPGIPKDIQPRVFDPFFTTREMQQGTGLGLSVAYGIVREHRGDIILESTPREGATFIVRLPIK